MATIITFPFTEPTNYTYDTDNVEITGGVAKLKDIRPTDSTSAAIWDNDINLTWGDGVTTATGTGSPVITSGQLDLSAASNQYVSYGATDNADSQQVGCMRMDYYPNYTGNPGNSQYIFGTFKANNDSDNQLQIYQLTNGNITLYMKNFDGSNIVQANLGAWSPTAGVKYTLELNWDITAGASRLFINGTQFGSTRGETGTRDSSIGLLRIGQHVNGTSGQSDFFAENFTYFSTVQHTSNHSGELPFDDPIKYSKDDETVVTNTSFISTELTDFASVETETGSDAVQYIITANSQDRWVTGGSAADSNGTYAESSTSAEMDSDINNIISARKTITVKLFLHSEYGGTTPEADSITITYDAALLEPTTDTIVSNVESFIYDTNGPVDGQSVEVRPYLKGFWNGDVFHQYAWETIATTDAEGFFSGLMYVQPDGEFWEMKHGTKRYKFAIPNEVEVNLKDATTWEVIED